MLPPFRIGNNVNPAALFANAYLIDTLYHQDAGAAQSFATLAGASLDHWEADPTTFPPDWLLVRDGTDHLLCFAGTTKFAQWASHVLSAFFPIIDTTTGHFSVGSFYVGLRFIEPSIMSFLGDLTGKTIRLSGHSYGGAAAYILALHLMLNPNPPAVVEVQTFGEPKSQGGSQNLIQPAIHDRIVYASDPVQFTPPSVTMLLGAGKLISVVKVFGDASWRHEGEAWNLSSGPIQRFVNPVRYAFQEPSTLLANGLLASDHHKMDVTYLPLSLQHWSSSGEHPEYHQLRQRANFYIAHPFDPPPSIGPSVTPATQNEQWFNTVAGPIDSTNQPYWQVASGFANVTPTGGSTVSKMKGSFLFNFGTGGFSESLYAVNLPGLTYQDMQAKLLTLLPYRCLLSRLPYMVSCKNPLTIFGTRVEDEEASRDALTTTLDPSTMGAGYTAVPTGINEIFSQNIRQNNACQVKWCGPNPQNQVITFLHGVALAATDNTLTDLNAVEMLKYAEMSSIYLTALRAYAHQIRLLGLGFRYLNSPWDVAGSPGPNAYPTAVTYNAAQQCYEFTMPSAPLKPRDRYVLRGFKNLNFLNGRHAGIAIGGTNVRILRVSRSVVWDGTGSLVPEVWGYFQPNETTPPVPTERPGVKHMAITGKKIGRPFGGQRGRQTARAI